MNDSGQGIGAKTGNWQQLPLAQALKMSQSEVSQSVFRSKYAGLLDGKGKNVMRLAFMDFLQYGLACVFPQKPGPVVRGMPTAHSAAPLNASILSDELYIWPWAKGKVRGHGIQPLYSSVPEAAGQDNKLYELLALADALRIGRARERVLAVNEPYQKKSPETLLLMDMRNINSSPDVSRSCLLELFHTVQSITLKS